MPVDYSKYPPDWKAISKRIREERANNKCEFCEAPNGKYIKRWVHDAGYWVEEGSTEYNNPLEEWCRPIRVVLTVAHLNHIPMDCRDENLKALCQRCHLRYDHEHHMKNSAATRARKKGLQNLFTEEAP